MLLCDKEIGCYILDNISSCSDCEFFNKNRKPIDIKKHYDIIGLGCSFTIGTAIRKKCSWFNLFGNAGFKICNLGVRSASIDLILHNLSYLLTNKISFDKITILLPNIYRRLFLIKKNKIFFVFQLTPQIELDFWLENNQYNIFTNRELKKIFEKCQSKLLLDNMENRFSLLLTKILRKLDKGNIDYYISSWDKDSYKILSRSGIDGKRLLEQFPNNDNGACDGRHPSEKIHLQFYEKIKSKIINT